MSLTGPSIPYRIERFPKEAPAEPPREKPEPVREPEPEREKVKV